MAQADSASALRTSLDPCTPGQAVPKLPRGWSYFRSEAGSGEAGWWYATPPYITAEVSTPLGLPVYGLCQTVDAASAQDLEVAVAKQWDFYQSQTGHSSPVCDEGGPHE